MKKHDLRYGGSVMDSREYKAIMSSVKESIKSGNWQAGLQAKKLEAEASKFLGVKYGILTTSGSCAGLLALSSLELPKGSEVIISAVTFPTIFNIILQCGLVPVVVDAKVGTYTFDISEVERAITKKTKAIIAIHPCGNPVDMPALMKMVKKQKQKIYVIEDNCDGWGSSIRGKKVGSFGDVSITSFHAAHIVSMGVGGGVFTNDKRIAGNVRMYRDWGRKANTDEPNKYKSLPSDYNPRFIYEKIGYNFQILELQAAMGRVQLRKSNQIKKARQKNFNYLVNGLSRFSNLILPSPIKGADVCWFALPLSVMPIKSPTIDNFNPEAVPQRGKLVAHLEKAGIETRSLFSGNICAHPAYRDSKFRISGTLEVADYIMKNSFWITCHPRLTKSDLDYIIKTFDDYFKEK